jgi:uncharacterized protein YggL (DUF469 family)
MLNLPLQKMIKLQTQRRSKTLKTAAFKAAVFLLQARYNKHWKALPTLY